MNFLKNVLATIVGLFLFFIIGFFMLMIIGGIMAAGGNNSKVDVKDNSIIKLDLSHVTNDYGGKIFIKDFEYKENKRDGLIDILYAIDYAKTDKRIKGISIENNNSMLGMAQRKALRDKLAEFKKTGKFVLAYADNYSQAEYYLNSIADTLYLNPLGSVDWKGLATEVIYMKDLQEKSGVQMEVIRHGKYKSAVEPFLQQTMSDANSKQNQELLTSIWKSINLEVANSRKTDTIALNKAANELLGRNAELALQNKLIDKIAYKDQYDNAIRKSLKIKKEDEIDEVEIDDYVTDVALKMENTAGKEIAVVFAQGEIRGGKGSVNIIGEEAVNEALIEARNNDDVKAIVLRVDSPGGSALVSEIIWREIELTKKVKPVIVSMGNVAASGGYYIACNADYIFAEPTTITGSIGVFGAIPNARNLANKIGINAEQVKTHQNAVGYSIFEPMDDTTRATITESIEHIYQVFLKRVSDGRKMPIAQVDSLAQGRIWTGVMAKQNGLVDEIGGLDAAIKYAANKVKLKEYHVALYPEYEIDFKDLLSNFLGASVKNAQEEMVVETIGQENFYLLKNINYLKQASGVQAMMPYQIIIK